jgi:hypothetical protein
MNTKILETVEGESRGKSGSSHYKVTAIQQLHEKYGLPYQATSYEMLLQQSMASGVGIHAVRLNNDVFLFGYADEESMFFDLEEVRKESLVEHAFIIRGKVWSR